MKVFYDLHIHSALSPCADDDMTPQNIVGMATLTGLDVIAITDHNACGNADAVKKAAEKADGPIVLCGAEITTSEDVHAVVLFKDFDSCRKCLDKIGNTRMRIKNDPNVFGNQFFMDENDAVVGTEEDLLITATGYSVDDLPRVAEEYGGVAFLSHVDKAANGIIAILGAIDEKTEYASAEVSPRASKELLNDLKRRGFTVLHNSDAHMLGAINERGNNFLELDELSADAVIRALRTK